MKRTSTLPIALVAASVAALNAGCDPKFPNGVDDNTHDDLGGSSGSPVITQEAVITGAIVAFHTELLAGGLSVAGDHDVAPAPGIRSFLGTDCMTITLVDAQAPIHAFDLSGCTDANGSVYGGQGEFGPPADATDGFVLTPDTSFDGAIGASNDLDPSLNTSVSAGSLKLEFQRNAGTVSGIVVSNFLRHSIGSTPNVSFSYDNVTYTGGIGEMGPYPDNGGVLHVAWDGVGIFDVNFDGGPNASYHMQNADYQVSLDTGQVRLSSVPLQ